MIDRRVLIAAAIAAAVLVGGGIWLVSSSVSSGSTAQPVSITAKQYQALVDIAAASQATPLAKSVWEGDGSYRFPGTCDALRAGYAAKGAPLPTGAKLSTVAGGIVLVKAKIATSAIIPSETGNECDYRITSDPTFVVAGNGPIAPVGGYLAVGCANPYKKAWQGLELVELSVGGAPLTIFIGPVDYDGDGQPPASSYSVLVANQTAAQLGSVLTDGSPSDLVASGVAKEYKAKLSADTSGRITATVGSGKKTETLTMTCNTSMGALLGGQ